MSNSDISGIIDRDAIRELVAKERRARDARDWSAMADCYTPDCVVSLSWFTGPARDFVEASRRRTSQTTSFHYIWPGTVEQAGGRALADTQMEVHVMMPFQGLEIEVISHCRLLNRVVRATDGWRIASVDVIYRWDEARCSDPAATMPITWDEIGRYRPSMRMATWMVVATGGKPDPKSLGYDRPEAVAAFLEREQVWLSGDGR